MFGRQTGHCSGNLLTGRLPQQISFRAERLVCKLLSGLQFNKSGTRILAQRLESLMMSNLENPASASRSCFSTRASTRFSGDCRPASPLVVSRVCPKNPIRINSSGLLKKKVPKKREMVQTNKILRRSLP
jgi:hypothetical protein